MCPRESKILKSSQFFEQVIFGCAAAGAELWKSAIKGNLHNKKMMMMMLSGHPSHRTHQLAQACFVETPLAGWPELPPPSAAGLSWWIAPTSSVCLRSPGWWWWGWFREIFVQEGVDVDLGDGTDKKSTLWWAMMSNELKESISLRMLVTYFYEKNGQRSLDRPTDSKMPTSNSHYPLCSFSLHYSAAMTSVTQSDWSSVTSWGSWDRECKWLKRAKDKLPDVVTRN